MCHSGAHFMDQANNPWAIPTFDKSVYITIKVIVLQRIHSYTLANPKLI